MCVPAAAAAGANLLIPIGMAVVNGISSFAQVRGQNLQAAAEAQAATRAYNMDLQALMERSRQLQSSFDTQALERSRQALRERAKIAVAAGEANVGGRSLLREISNSLFQESYDIGIQKENLENRQAQTSLQAQGLFAQAQGRFNTAQSRRINPFLGALMIGGSAAQGYFGAPRIGK